MSPPWNINYFVEFALQTIAQKKVQVTSWTYTFWLRTDRYHTIIFFKLQRTFLQNLQDRTLVIQFLIFYEFIEKYSHFNQKWR